MRERLLAAAEQAAERVGGPCALGIALRAGVAERMRGVEDGQEPGWQRPPILSDTAPG